MDTTPVSLLRTITIETIVLIAIWFLIPIIRKVKFYKIILTGVLSSLATIPYLWFVLPEFFENWYVLVAIGEISVTLIESLIIWQILKINWKYAFAISIACNLVSFLLGVFMFNPG